MEMATANLGELMEAINRTDVGTKRELLAQLTYALRDKDTPTSSVNNAAWEALCAVSEGRSVPMAHFAESYGKGKLKRDLDWLNDYADRVCARKLTVTERGVVLRFMLGCLAEHLSDRHDIRPKTMLNSLDSLPSALDWAFPGYADARLIDRIALMRKAA